MQYAALMTGFIPRRWPREAGVLLTAIAAICWLSPRVALAADSVGPSQNAGATPAADSTPAATDADPATGPVDLTRTVSLNFKDIGIADVLRALADQAHTNIVTAGGVTGNVTIKLTNVSLETALQFVTRTNKLMYYVDNANRAIVVGTPEQIEAYNSKPSGPVLVNLSHAAAADLAKGIATSFPSVTATPQGSDILLLSGPADQVTAARQLIQALDIPPISAAPSPTTQAVITLQTASPADVSGSLTKLFPKLTVIAQGQRLLVLSGSQDDVQNASALVQKLDIPPVISAPGTQTITYLARYADVYDLTRILAQQVPSVLAVPGPGPAFIPGGMGGGGMSGGSGSSMGGGMGGSGGGGMSGASGGTGGSSGGAGGSSGGAMGSSGGMGGSMGGGGMSGGGSGSSGGMSGGLAMRTNLLLLTGTLEDLRTAQSVLAKVDVPPQQVRISTRVMDVDLEHLSTIGLTWSTSNYGFGENSGTGATTTGTTGSSLSGPSIFPFKAFPLVRMPLSASLDLLATDSNSKVLASPTIMALSDRPADIFIGDEVHYVSNIDQTQFGSNVTTQTENVGIELSMMAHVEPDDQITLSVHPDVSVLTQLVPGANGAQLPLISKRSASTVMRLNSGQTIAIGGLIQDSDINAFQKVPFLGDLPFFGELFRHRQKTHKRSEVVIFITATVVPQS